MATGRGEELAEAIALMARLRGPNGCPWDREQTFDTIKKHTLEETYEVFDAIDRRAWPELKDELGDLLLQVLFYAQMAEEAGYFSIEEVAASLSAKLIRRHPHLFGEATAETAADVNRNWERVKQAEKADRGEAEGDYLDQAPAYLPALLEAEKLGRRAAKVGFDWTERQGLVEKLHEETGEIQVELLREQVDPAAVEEELGDLLFTAVQLARHAGVQPEFALRGANRKFRRRFAVMERMAGGVDGLQQASAGQMEQWWTAAKAALSKA